MGSTLKPGLFVSIMKIEIPLGVVPLAVEL